MISVEFSDYLIRRMREWDESLIKDIPAFEFKGEWRQWNGDWWETREMVRRLSEMDHYKPSIPPKANKGIQYYSGLKETRAFTNQDWVPAASGMVGDPL